MSRRVYCHDDVLGMRMVANVTARVGHESGGYLIEANSEGFRCRHEFVAAATPGTRRILLFGDSFTVGTGVRADLRFGNLLEEAFDDVEVYNFGLTGSGTDQQYLAHRHIGAKLDHDLVVLAPWIENIRRNPAHHRVWNDRWADSSLSEDSVVLQPKPYFELEADGSLKLGNTPVPKPVPYDSVEEANTGSRGQRFDGLRELVKTRAPWAKDVLQRVSRLQPVPEYDKPDDPAWLLMKAIIVQWHSELDRPMLLCPIPMYQHIESQASSDGYRARFRELHRPNDGLIFHDALPELQKAPKGERRNMRFDHDIHFNERGHAAFARALIEGVQPLLTQTASTD